MLLIYLLALIPAFLIFGEKPLRETLIALAVPAVYFLISVFLLKKGILINAATPILSSLASGVGIGIYNFFRVAVERQNFFKMSVTDGLTGLFNIRYFKLLLETEIIMAKSDPTKIFTIIMSDVDHFKKFNDTYGHQVGDLVLKEVANALKNSVRASDIVARYGGEEMIILLRGTPLKNGLVVAEKIRKNIEESLVRDRNNTYKVTASLGVSTCKPIDTVDSIIKRADEGLYQAKESGRNRVCSTESILQPSPPP
jgi:diguanylate cyclase (GGDEF)-like protein